MSCGGVGEAQFLLRSACRDYFPPMSFFSSFFCSSSALPLPMTFANEPVPAEKKEKKDMSSGKANDEQKKDEKKDMGGK